MAPKVLGLPAFLAAARRSPGQAGGREAAGIPDPLPLIVVTSDTPSAADLHLVVGYDGSPPASRALDAAVRLLQGRTGRITVVYVAHMPGLDALSPGALAEMEVSFDEIEEELRAAAGELLSGRAEWGFQRRAGLIADELLAAADTIHAAHPNQTVVIVVGSSSHAVHRVLGSVAVSLARRAPVPLIVVP
jgi:nucleotide-binding universal stress UspA family protein